MWKNPPLSDLETHWLSSLFAGREDPGPPKLPSLCGLLLERWHAWFAPIGQLEGRWLEGAVSIANAHTALGAALLRLQTALDRAVANHRRAFQAIPFSSPSPLHAELAWLDALARHGSAFLPEILGFTLAHAKLNGGWFNLDRSASYQAVEAATQAVLALVEDQARVAAGWAFYHRRSHSWALVWEALAGDLRRQVAWLFREKAPKAIGYHRRVYLAGRPLDQWLERLDAEPWAFLQVFLASPLRERFFSAALAFDGPMFGVFSQAELELVRAWLRWEETNPKPDPPSPILDKPLPAPPPSNPDRAKRLSPKQLYYQLLNLERFPACLPAAKRYAAKILRRARTRPPFFYTPDAFCRWVEEMYARENQPGPVLAPPALSKTAYRFGIEQLAPSILVDGCWLARSLTLARTYREVGQRLWQIFRDEVGDGDPSRNHANVYRKLIAQAGIALPPFDSEAFIHHPFIPFAFDLPAFLLTIGQFPEEFLPELLGLNLAIELSGLGRTYRRLAWELECHGLDASIVRLHQSIDNLASGHAALACEAILCHLKALASGGEEVIQQQWRRVFTGYRAFAVVLRRFFWTLALHLGLRFHLGESLARLWA